MKMRKMMIGMLAACMMVSLAGCGSTNASMDKAVTESMSVSHSVMQEESKVFYDSELIAEEYYGEMKAESTADAPGSQSESGGSAENTAVQQERKLIKTVNMDVETKEFDRTLAALDDKIAELGGYIESLDTYNGSSYSSYRSTRNANMTIRIPKQHLDTFLETVEGVSNVVRRSESVEDVTLTYVDLESHKKVLLAEQERLLELIKKAEAIEDIITIENRLSDVRYKIESMEAQLRTYDNKVDYSTIYLNIDEVKELTPVAEKTALERIADGFVGSLKDIKEGLTEFAIWFVVNIPYFVLWIMVLIFVIVLTKVILKLTRKVSAGKKERSTVQQQDSMLARDDKRNEKDDIIK